MKKRVAILFVWLFIFFASYAQTPQVQWNSLKDTIARHQGKFKEIEADIKELSHHVDCLEYALDKQQGIIAQEQSTIENTFSATSWQLNIFAMLLTIGGIALGWFISRKEKNMKNLLDAVEEKQNEITVLKQDIEKTDQSMRKLNDEIQNNVDGLYKRLQRNETISLLERLAKVPEDIGNLENLLLTRDLYPEDFDMLFNAYTTLMKEYAENEMFSLESKRNQNKYLSLFFQHFCGKSIQTEMLRKELTDFFSIALQCAFKSDVKNSLSSLIEALNCTAIDGGNDIILTKYIQALHASQHKDYIEPYQLIVDKCNASMDLQSVWNKLIGENIVIKPLGNLLCDKYKEDVAFVQKVKGQIATIQQDKKTEKPEKTQEG